MKVNSVIMLEYKYLLGELGKDKQNEILDLIDGLNFDLAFPIIAGLNSIVRENSLKSYKDEIEFWFGSKSMLSDFYLNRIAVGYNEHLNDNLKLLNIWSNLTLLQRFLEAYQLGKLNNHEVEDVNQIHDRLFKAYLLINELYITKFNDQDVINSVPNYVGTVMKNGVIIATMLLPYHDLNNIDIADALISQFIKAVYFFQFAELYLGVELEAFLKKYGVSTWQEYLKEILPIARHALQNNKHGLGYLEIDVNHPRALFIRNFLNNLSIESKENGFSEHDFILLRSKPLMLINANKFLLIDNLLVYNKIYNSLFFEFKDAIKVDSLVCKKEDFKSYINNYFSESFLTKQILNTLFFDNRYFKFSGEEIRQNYGNNFNAEPDFYVRNGMEIFLFEFKDTLINGDIKQSFNSERVLNELKSKLWFKEIPKKNNIKEVPKAVRQLQNNIRRIAINSLPFDQDLEHKHLKIFPIFLYIDQSLSTPGINEIVNEWFKFDLEHDKELAKVSDRLSIMPLTMIDLDTLIIFQDGFKFGNLKLEELIHNFWAYKKGLSIIGNQNVNKATIDSNLSFGTFLRLKRKKRKAPEIFNDFGKLLFNEIT